MKIIRIDIDEVKEVEIQGSLKDYQDQVGGMIEALLIPNGIVAYINEEGKILGLDRNPVATHIAHELIGIAPADYIAGPMILLGEGDSAAPGKAYEIARRYNQLNA